MSRASVQILVVFAALAAWSAGTADAGRDRRRAHEFRKVGPGQRRSTSVLVVRRPLGDVFERATTTPVRRLFPRPWRARTARPDAALAEGLTIEAAYAPLPPLAVAVPVRVTEVEAGGRPTVAYDYLPGGISTGTNTIRFFATRERGGRPATVIVHDSRYSITQPILRVVPWVYRWIHRAFVAGLVRELERDP